MKVVVWGINYAPEPTGIGPYNTALCEFLAERGHEMHMVTSFPYYPRWKKEPTDEGRLYRREEINQVQVHRCWHFVPRRVTTISRIIHELTFVLISFLRVVSLRQADVMVVVSPPLLIGLAAWLVSLFRGWPFIFHVQDLQPDAAAGLGMVRSGKLLRVLRAVERCAYSKAARVSGISPSMLEAFRGKKVPSEKVVYFPNPLRQRSASQLPVRGAFRRRHGIGDDEFLAVYSGNLGRKQGLGVLVDAASHLRGKRVRIVICGEGNQRQELEAFCAHTRPTQLTLLPLQSASGYEELMVDTDLCLITQQPGTGRFFLPSKVLAALTYRKPVLSVADAHSDLAQMISTGQFGINLEPGRPQELASVLASLAQDPTRLRDWSEAGESFARQFEPDDVLGAIESVLGTLCGHVPESAIALLPVIPSSVREMLRRFRRFPRLLRSRGS